MTHLLLRGSICENVKEPCALGWSSRRTGSTGPLGRSVAGSDQFECDTFSERLSRMSRQNDGLRW